MMYAENTGWLVACPFIEYVQITREGQGNDVVAFCPSIADLLLLYGLA
jgi:hypothetical protein